MPLHLLHTKPHYVVALGRSSSADRWSRKESEAVASEDAVSQSSDPNLRKDRSNIKASNPSVRGESGDRSGAGKSTLP